MIWFPARSYVLEMIVDPAHKICIVLPHPSDKDKGVARVGHPNSVAIHKGRIANLKGFALMHVSHVLAVAAFVLPFMTAPMAQSQQKASPPLPEIRQLLREAHEHQKQLEKVRENYTFSASYVVQEIDGKGQVTKTETHDSEIFYVHGQPIVRLVKKDGKPLTEEEQKKETERVTKAVEKAEKPEPDKPKDDQEISLRRILEAADVRNPRRENFRGRSTIVFDFVGQKDLKAHGINEDLSKKLQGTVWIDEADRQVARLEVTLDDNFHVAGGLVANIQKGSRFTFDQAPVNGEIWFPTGTEVSVQMRVLLVKGIHEHVTERDYDYKRFHVETQQGKDAKAVVETKP
jgi:hypothetical protein